MPAGEIAQSGPLVVAAALSVAAGAVSFASPCILPLVPGYLGFVSGLSGADVEEGGGRSRATVLAGSLLFVAGFATFFTLLGGAFGAVGSTLSAHRGVLGRLGGILVVAMGLFLLGVWRPRRLNGEVRATGLVTRSGLVAAYPMGLVFGAGWTPCIGPTLAGILTLTTVGSDASPARGALLAFLYALGLGIPFVAIGLLLQHGLGALAVLRRHAMAVERLGGAMLVVVGLLLVSGLWDRVLLRISPLVGNFTTPL